MSEIILHQKQPDGGFKEIIIEIDASSLINLSSTLPSIKQNISLMEAVTQDMFIIIDEQQLRINELTDKLNSVINFLK